MTNPSEKRKFVRLKVNHLTRHIKFKLPGIDIYPNKDAESKDLSAGGLLFTTEYAYRLGDILRMEVHLPGWEKYKSDFFKTGSSTKGMPILVLVKVVRVQVLKDGNFDIGVSFVGIDEEHQLALIKYVEHQLKEK